MPELPVADFQKFLVLYKHMLTIESYAPRIASLPRGSIDTAALKPEIERYKEALKFCSEFVEESHADFLVRLGREGKPAEKEDYTLSDEVNDDLIRTHVLLRSLDDILRREEVINAPKPEVKLREPNLSEEDCPNCGTCGSIMTRNGNCYKCHNCGSTSGCS